MLNNLFRRDANRREAIASGYVVPDPERCMQCGICTYNCPIGLDTRSFAWKGIPVRNSQCLTCGECVRRCPRGVWRFERTDLFARA